MECPMSAKWLSVVWVLAAAVVAIAPGGCGRATKTAVPIEGVPVASDYGTNVDVTNWNGSVYIVADPRFKDAKVSAKVRSLSRNLWQREGDLVAGADVKAVSTVGTDGRILRVISQPADDPPRPIAVDLYIRVPKVSGTRVRNSGGPVEVVRVEGPIDIENGVGGGPGGDIQVRTGAAMTGPATLVTTSGSVLYQVGPGSTGRFDLMTDEGPAPQFSSRLGETSDVRPEFNRYSCVFNNGGNPVVLRSGNGLVRATVMEDAAEYGPEIWDGWPRWPSKPRFVGRLGGYYNDEPALTHMRRQMRELKGRASTVAPEANVQQR